MSLDQNRTKKIGIVEIAEELQIPQHFLSKILQNLVNKGLIYSVRGPHGGFFTKEPILKTTILDIVKIVDGLSVLKKCFLGREECSSENPCPMHDEFESCREGIFDTFRNKTIGDLVQGVESGETTLSGIA